MRGRFSFNFFLLCWSKIISKQNITKILTDISIKFRAFYLKIRCRISAPNFFQICKLKGKNSLKIFAFKILLTLNYLHLPRFQNKKRPNISIIRWKNCKESEINPKPLKKYLKRLKKLFLQSKKLVDSKFKNV